MLHRLSWYNKILQKIRTQYSKKKTIYLIKLFSMCELWIERGKDTGNYLLADLEDIKPSMTYGPNDIAELKERQTTISMTIKLKKTPQNCHILEQVHLPDADTHVPYEKHNCCLYSNGHTLPDKGSYLILKKITDTHFETQIKRRLATFFDKLKDAKMSEIYLVYVYLGLD